MERTNAGDLQCRQNVGIFNKNMHIKREQAANKPLSVAYYIVIASLLGMMVTLTHTPGTGALS